jgi:hypothetical protein
MATPAEFLIKSMAKSLIIYIYPKPKKALLAIAIMPNNKLIYILAIILTPIIIYLYVLNETRLNNYSEWYCSTIYGLNKDCTK